MKSRLCRQSILLTAALALLALSSSASALIITGGPIYTLPGGGSCTVANIPSRLTGATVTCTGVALGSHTNVYFGIKNDTNINGLAMDGSGPTGGEIYAFASNLSASITYTSTTSITSANPSTGFGTDTVANTMVVALSAGAASVVSTGGNPVSNGNGAIERLFRLTSGTSFTFEVDMTSVVPHASGQSCTGVYDPTFVAAPGGTCVNRVDLAFYYSDCGDGVVDSPEQCDQGGANGTSTSCCTSSCTYRASGAVCRPGSGDFCDLSETCTGSSPICPANDAPGKAGVSCRPGSGDACDLTETCTGVLLAPCPADDAPGNAGDLCNAGSGDLCDPDETCTGTPTAPCPSDTIASSGTLCRGGSGDSCDVDETCTGVANAPCPADDAPGNSGDLCRSGSGDSCDVDETCTGTPGAACPADDAPGNAGDVCNSGSGDLCDPDETCTGTPTAPCPSDTISSNSTVCRTGSGDSCDVDETCTGVADQACPGDDAPGNSGVVCRASTAGDMCDLDETCTGTPGQTCPADDAPGNAGVECRADAGDCDVAEQCTGVPNASCPVDGFELSGTTCTDDGETCTTDLCDGSGSCEHDPGNSGAVCRPDAGSCDVQEVCNGVLGTCPADALEPNGTSCADGDFCDGAEECQSGVCTDTADPCPILCDEINDMCTVACGDEPVVGCRTSAKSILLIKDETDNTKDKLIFKFIKGQSTDQAEFGSPVTTTDLALCIYGTVAGSSAALLDPVVQGGGPNWGTIGTKGYKYKDSLGTQNGIQKVILKGSDDGKTKILIKGRGTALPDLDTGTLPFQAANFPIVAQVTNSTTGVCWEASLAQANTKKNTATQYKAKKQTP